MIWWTITIIILIIRLIGILAEEKINKVINKEYYEKIKEGTEYLFIKGTTEHLVERIKITNSKKGNKEEGKKHCISKRFIEMNKEFADLYIIRLILKDKFDEKLMNDEEKLKEFLEVVERIPNFEWLIRREKDCWFEKNKKYNRIEVSREIYATIGIQWYKTRFGIDPHLTFRNYWDFNYNKEIK